MVVVIVIVWASILLPKPKGVLQPWSSFSGSPCGALSFCLQLGLSGLSGRCRPVENPQQVEAYLKSSN